MLRAQTISTVLFAVCFVSLNVAGSRVDVDVTFSRSSSLSSVNVTKTLERSRPKESYILLIDHSGSMRSVDGRGDNRSRWDMLKAGLKNTLGSLPAGSEVRVIKFSSGVEPLSWGAKTDFLELKNEEDSRRIFDRIESLGRPDGRTALYDALGEACMVADGLLRKGYIVQIIVFSDGKDEGSKRYKESDITRDFRGLFDNPHFKVCPVWVSPSPKPDKPLVGGIWLDSASPFILFVGVQPVAVSLPNPMVAGVQKTSVRYDFSMPDTEWNQIKGKPISLELSFDGDTPSAPRRVLTRIVDLKIGCVTIPLDLSNSDLPTDRDVTASLRLTDIPVPSRAKIIAPSTTRVVFSKPGEITITGVLPASGTTVRVGDEILFSLQTLSGARCLWSFGDGSSAEGVSVRHSYKSARSYDFKATVSMQGLLPGEVTGRIEVVDVGVVLSQFVDRAVVGVPYTMTCRSRGPISRYEWLVDGLTYSGDDQHEKATSSYSHIFQKSGNYRIQVRGVSKSVPFVLSEERMITVYPAPFIIIGSPKAGQEICADSTVEFEAGVEGGMSNVLWRIRDAGNNIEHEIQSQVIAGVSKTAPIKFTKGGVYTAIASSQYLGKDVSSVAVSFRVPPPDLRVDIEQPLADQRLETGKEYPLSARVIGPLKQIRWFSIDEDSRLRNELGTSAVDGSGSSKKVVLFRPEDGDRLLSIGAEGIVADNEPVAVTSPLIPVSLFTPGTVQIESPVNYTKIEFRKDLVFKAVVSGLAKDIRWMFDTASGPVELGKGESIAGSFAQDGRQEALITVTALAALPGGRTVYSIPVVVHAFCPPVLPEIMLPMINGVSQVNFKLHEKITFGLGVAGPVSSVEWDFGDGNVTNAAAGATHSYTEYGSFVITAKAHCSRCQSVEMARAEINVIKTPLKAKFEILPDRETFSVGGTLKLVDQSEGDVDRVLWVIDEIEVAGVRGETKEVSLPHRPAELSFGVGVVSKDGETASVYVRTVRVRFGWWAVLPIFLAALLVWWLLFRLLTGNGPRGWIVYAWDGPRPRLLNGGFPEERNPGSKGFPSPVKQHWNWITKRAKIPLVELLGYSDDDDASGGGWRLVSLEENFVIRSEGGVPFVDFPSVVTDESGTVGGRDETHYYLYKDALATIGPEREFIRIFVVDESSSGWLCPVLMILSTFTIIGAVFWLCLKYAV